MTHRFTKIYLLPMLFCLAVPSAQADSALPTYQVSGSVDIIGQNSPASELIVFSFVVGYTLFPDTPTQYIMEILPGTFSIYETGSFGSAEFTGGGGQQITVYYMSFGFDGGGAVWDLLTGVNGTTYTPGPPSFGDGGMFACYTQDCLDAYGDTPGVPGSGYQVHSNDVFQVSVTLTPEPSLLAMLIIGGFAFTLLIAIAKEYPYCLLGRDD